MNEIVHPISWVILLLGVSYASRSARSWASQFVRKHPAIQVQSRSVFERTPEEDLAEMFKRAAWQGYWKGVFIMFGAVFATEAFSHGDKPWIGLAIYFIIAIAICIRLLNKNAPNRLWG